MHLIESVHDWGHGSCSPTYLAVHETANPGASAANHASLYASGSWQYVVQYVLDWTGDVYHCMYDDRLAWGVGNGNRHCVNVEICHATSREQFDRTWQTAVEFCAWYLTQRGWTIDQMISHDDARRMWGGTDHTDPIGYFREFGRTWEQFREEVRWRMGNAGNWVQDARGWWYRNSDGSWPRLCWQKIDGYWYWFDGDGYAAKGWIDYNGNRYYCRQAADAWGPECSMIVGWIGDGGHWYRTDAEGAIQRNCVLEVDGRWYAFNALGERTSDVRVAEDQSLVFG